MERPLESPPDWQQLVMELEECWIRGECTSVEEFLRGADSPLAAIVMESEDPSGVIALVQLEIELRRRRGESLEIGEFTTRFPQVPLDILRDLLACPAIPKLASSSLMLPVRYQLTSQIGSGGVGEVWRAWDAHMRRTVAIKVVHAPYRANRQANVRLEREASLTGSLQHPGVPAVHDFGKLADGSGYVVMKLVAGETLAARLARPRDHRRDLPTMLTIFEQIAQTIAYAHTQGVIHRDLKPHNIMVGSFGEVQVLDWGMAKRLREPQAAGDSQDLTDEGDEPLRDAFMPVSASPSTTGDNPEASTARGPLSLTQAGDVVGTPAYMSPEQARGEIAAIGPASDVFGLGAILFEMLCGTRLHAGHSGSHLVEHVARGDLTGSLEQLEATDVDSQLKDICRTCLASDPSDRPVDASSVAEQVTQYLETVQQRLQQAELERTAAEVRIAEERKRRRIAIGLSAAVAATFLLGLLGVLWQWKQAVVARDVANLQTVLAEERFLQAKQTVDEYLTEVSQSKALLASTPGTQQLRRNLLKRAKTYYTSFVQTRPDDPQMKAELADAYLALGRITRQLEVSEEPVPYLQQTLEISQELIDEGFEVRQASQRILATQWELATIYDALGQLDQSRSWSEEALAFAQTLTADERQDPITQQAIASAHQSLALAKSRMGDDQGAEESYRQALELQQLLLNQVPQDRALQLQYAHSLRSLALSHLERQEVKTAREYLQSAYERLSHLAEENPADGSTSELWGRCGVSLAQAHWQAAETEQAIQLLQVVCQRLDRLTAANPAVISYKNAAADAYNCLANYLVTQDDERCFEVFDVLIPMLRQAVADHPESIALMYRLADALSMRAERFLDLLQPEQGLLDREEALDTHMRIRELSPDSRDIVVEIVQDYRTLGILRRQTGKIDEAEAAYSTAVGLIEEMEQSGTANVETIRTKAGILNNLGFLYSATNRLDLAREPYQQAAEIYGQLAEGDPSRSDFIYQASTLANLGSLLGRSGETPAGIESFDRAIALLAQAREQRPADKRIKQFLFGAFVERGDAHARIRDYQAARQDFETAIELFDGYYTLVVKLKLCLAKVNLGLVDEGVREAWEMAAGQDSDLLSLAATVTARAAVLSAEDESLTPAAREQRTAGFATQTAELLNSALDTDSFRQMQLSTLFGDETSIAEILDRPEMRAVAERVEPLLTPPQ